jgi:hypothetical protein
MVLQLDGTLEEIREQLNPEEYPETVACIDSMQDEDFGGLYELASELVNCDKTKTMPQFLFDFIVFLYKECIQDDDDRAMCDLGALYYMGRNGKSDFAEALRYYEMAADKGNRQAQENLGYCYYYGRNVEVDYKRAFHYFALGAFDGHLNSLYKIGDMYRNGYYVEKNPQEAFRIYLHCMGTMTEEAENYIAGPVLLRLGEMMLSGEGTEKDLRGALVCFQKAEAFLYSMVMDGEVEYRRSLKGAIEGQAKARAEMEKTLPELEWKYD